MTESMGLKDMHCIRIITELSRMMTAMDPMDLMDFEDDDEF